MHVNQSPFGAMAWFQRSPCGGRRHGCQAPQQQETQALMMRQRSMLSVSGTANVEGSEGTQTRNSVSAVQRVMLHGSTSAAGAGGDALVYDAATMRRQKANLSILTQDGDSVAIRFRSRDAIAVQSGASTGEGTDPAPTDLRLYSFAAGRVEIAVQGQLDEDELQAIGDLVQKVDALASQFFGGDMEAAFSAAADLGFDGSEIASFSLRMSLKESVGVRIPVQPSPAPAVAPTDQAQAVAGEALAQSSDPASSVPDAVPVEPIAAPLVEAADEPAAVETPEATSPAAEQAPAGQGSDVPSLQEILGSYLQQVMGSLADIGSAGRVELSMSWKMRLMAAALEVPTQPAGQTPGAALLGESLQSAAAARA